MIAYEPHELRDLPTLAQGQCADLKIESPTWRVWLSRMTPADGETRPVQYEKLTDGRWLSVDAQGVEL
jgi:hypothetical protein